MCVAIWLNWQVSENHSVLGTTRRETSQMVVDDRMLLP